MSLSRRPSVAPFLMVVRATPSRVAVWPRPARPWARSRSSRLARWWACRMWRVSPAVQGGPGPGLGAGLVERVGDSGVGVLVEEGVDGRDHRGWGAALVRRAQRRWDGEAGG